MEIRDPKLPKSITGLTFFYYDILYNIDRRKGRRAVGNKKRDEKLKNYGSLIGQI
ncbi:MAG TPA: hypothetical protein VE244_02645 [Nitrososphaeraceae archaeon]|nr:hypothetical protein [Nitrososphaeraceae archaeon]